MIKINNYKFNLIFHTCIYIYYPVLLNRSKNFLFSQAIAKAFCPTILFRVCISGGDFSSKLRRSLSRCWIFFKSSRGGARNERFLTILPDRKTSAEFAVRLWRLHTCRITKPKESVLLHFIAVLCSHRSIPSLADSLRVSLTFFAFRLSNKN